MELPETCRYKADKHWNCPQWFCGVVSDKTPKFETYMLWSMNSRIHHDYLTSFNFSSPSLTWNLKLMVSKRNLLFQGVIFRFHVKLWEGFQLNVSSFFFHDIFFLKYSLDISGYPIMQSWLDTRAGWDSKPGDLRRFPTGTPILFLGSWFIFRVCRMKWQPQILRKLLFLVLPLWFSKRSEVSKWKVYCRCSNKKVSHCKPV